MKNTIQIPITHTVDLLILGGSTGAVEAAVAAADSGASVLLVSSFTYPGEDVCASLNFWFDRQIKPVTDLSKTLFKTVLKNDGFPTPMNLKLQLEKAIVDGGVDLLYNSWPLYLLRGDNGQLAGVVIANRSGYQAVRAGVVIDATERALAGRLTKARFRPFIPGTKLFSRTVITGRTQSMGAEDDFIPLSIEKRKYRAYRHLIELNMPDSSPLSFAGAEAEARLKTWDPLQIFTSDQITTMHSDRLDTGDAQQKTLAEDGELELQALRCGNDPIFLLSHMADLSDDAAEALSHPYLLMAAGRSLGKRLAPLSRELASTKNISIDTNGMEEITDLTIVRKDIFLRHQEAPTVELNLSFMPTLASVDVAVAGGGTAGAPAGIAAARAGASTLIAEILPALGGVATEGRIASYWFGNRCGFSDEIDRGVHGMGSDPDYELTSSLSNPEWKKSWYLKTLKSEGAEVLLHTLTLAAAVKDKRLAGIVVAGSYGFGLLRASAVVDSTGNSDLAAAAGAETVNIGADHLAVQGTGLGPIRPTQHCTNTDYTFVDDTDVMDVTRAFLAGRIKFAADYDLIRMVNSRQRQQIVGDITLDPFDFLTHRTFSDTIVTACSNFDTHGFTIHPVFMAKAPGEEALKAHVPLRCLLPRGMERILVTGLGVSCHRDSLPVIRMQVDVQNQGYAAGYIAAQAAAQNIDLRQIDIRAIQQHLVEVGIIDPDVLTHEDSPAHTETEAIEAVKNGTGEYAGLALIFAQPHLSVPALRQAFRREVDNEHKLHLAHLLGLLGDATGADTLTEYLTSESWDEGWHYTGMGQFGMCLSLVDSRLIALSRTRDKATSRVILEKISSLSDDAEFSHIRALTLALENVMVPAVAPILAKHLKKMAGHTCTSLKDASTGIDTDRTNTSERNAELKEIYLARALFACGDHEGQGAATLKKYQHDLHGHYARHARALLTK